MSNNTVDIAIVGGGLVGMMSAYCLAADKLKIAIFDKSKLAGESSWAGGGILTPLYPWRYADAVNALSLRSQQLYPALIAQLKQESGMDPEYYRSGMLISEQDMDTQAFVWLQKHKIAKQKAQASDLRNLSTRDDYILLPDICQVRNPRLAATLKRALQSKVEMHEHCDVSGIERDSKGCFELKTEQGNFSAEKVIVSAGAWSAHLLKQLGMSLPVKPVRGQMLLFKAPEKLLSAIVLAEGKYMIPRQDGHVLVGSTMEDVGFDKQTTSSAQNDLLRFVKSRCPELAKQPVIRHWAGLRPASPQGVPYIFQHPSQAGLFVNTGHFRNGVVLALASAELIKDLVLDHQPALDHEAYGFSRAPAELAV